MQALPHLGFTTDCFRREHKKNFFWRWSLARAAVDESTKVEPYKVDLYQWKTADSIDKNTIALTLGAAADFAKPPNLLRAAVVSSPLYGKNKEPVHEQLNEALIEGIEEAARRAAVYFEKGSWKKTSTHPRFKPPPPESAAACASAMASMYGMSDAHETIGLYANQIKIRCGHLAELTAGRVRDGATHSAHSSPCTIRARRAAQPLHRARAAAVRGERAAPAAR